MIGSVSTNVKLTIFARVMRMKVKLMSMLVILFDRRLLGFNRFFMSAEDREIRLVEAFVEDALVL